MASILPNGHLRAYSFDWYLEEFSTRLRLAGQTHKALVKGDQTFAWGKSNILLTSFLL